MCKKLHGGNTKKMMGKSRGYFGTALVVMNTLVAIWCVAEQFALGAVVNAGIVFFNLYAYRKELRLVWS